MSESRDPDLLDTTGLKRAEVQSALQVVANLCDRHRINALDDFLQSSRTFAQEENSTSPCWAGLRPARVAF
jgi:hypothetical protein